jgi:hypothetical protein
MCVPKGGFMICYSLQNYIIIITRWAGQKRTYDLGEYITNYYENICAERGYY